MVKERFLINEVAKEVHVESHVLRYWEEELALSIGRNDQGHRVYTKEDIDKFIRIKQLKDQGLQLKAVKSFLENMYVARTENADNPFAQKHLTKINRNGDIKMAQMKSASEEKIMEKFTECSKSKCNKAEMDKIESDKSEKDKPELNTPEQNNAVVQKHELAIQIKEMNDIEDVQQEKSQRLQYLFQKLIKEAVAENNAAMTETLVERITENVKSDLCKELDYQFRIMEEREEQRVADRQEQQNKRDEEYYKKLDELLRKCNSKSLKPGKAEKEKKKAVHKSEKMDSNVEKEKKQKIFFWKKNDEEVKRDFKLVGKPAEVK